MNYVQKVSNCINTPSSQTFKSYVPNWLLYMTGFECPSFYNTVSSWTMRHWMLEWQTHNSLEGSGHGLNIGTTPAFGQRDCEKPLNPSVRIASVQAEIQTEHLSNLSPQHYHYAIYLNFQSNNSRNR
jgi:hypothetical protein